MMNKCNPCLLLLFILLLSACNSDYSPKPRGYYRIDFPRKEYVRFEKPGFPYSFEYPVYGSIVQDSLFFDEKAENPYWINIDFPEFNGRIHISYKHVRGNFDSLVNDAFTLATKQHINVASGMDQKEISTPQGSGIYFSLKGNTATANQFFITDSVKHFLRGALYFAATPNEDSLRPVNDFLKKDVERLISSLQWRR